MLNMQRKFKENPDEIFWPWLPVVFLLGVMAGLTWSFIQQQNNDVRLSDKNIITHTRVLSAYTIRKCITCHEAIEWQCTQCHKGEKQ